MTMRRYAWVAELVPAVGEAVAPACGPETVAAVEAELGPGPVAWGVQTCARIVASAPPTGFSGTKPVVPGEDEAQRRSYEVGLFMLLQALYTGRVPSELRLSPEALELNQHALHRRMPLAGMFQAMWQVNLRVQQALLDFLAEHDLVGSPTEALLLAAQLSESVISYVEAIQDRTQEAWERDLRLWEEQTAVARRRAIRQLIEGTVEAAEAEQVLGVRLRAHHVGLIAARRRAGGALSGLADDLHRAVALLTDTDARFMCVETDDDTIAAWLTFAAPPEAAELRSLHDGLASLTGVWCAVGPRCRAPRASAVPTCSRGAWPITHRRTFATVSRSSRWTR
ncbi:hypothetical protein ACFWPQ_49380 [Streptomyces sp. NPDC058464]|uniref:hypothetical protein n=1 Tax=Streptomyces sp. NPDC058464 TaxID=3346511 RepID=UPI00364C7340